jgi:hypothetical protein
VKDLLHWGFTAGLILPDRRQNAAFPHAVLLVPLLDEIA